MGKSIGGLLAGVILATVLFICLSSPFPMAATSGDASQPETLLSDNITDSYQSISSVLTEAANQFQDEDLARFYGKLIDSYELDEASSWLAPGDGSDDPGIVPDIEKITRMAITLPLLEVRAQIQDEDIAAFYQDFLEKAGWIEE
uniref:Uncharacterized protein n=1 Tax=viral metagenome TaxID=1070528 RepID=A0A6H1Z683_9ZZZZ